ncbi:MAG: cellulase family glycosylhydrolase, partial [Chloroflexi bacterium]|nr:cellulase family glycosylhydrolase [Chloroflexota bacterium]
MIYRPRHVEKQISRAIGLSLICLLVLIALPVADAQKHMSVAQPTQEHQVYLPLSLRYAPPYQLFMPLYLAPSAGFKWMQSAHSPSYMGQAGQQGGLSDLFVRRVGEDLQLNGQPYTFIGTNVSYLAGPFFPEEKVEEIIAFLADNGVQVIRVWVEPWCDLDRVERMLDMGHVYNIRFILTLQDFFGKQDGWWFKSVYLTKDLPHIRNIVPCFANRPEVLMWELMNEPTCPAQDANPSCWNAFVRWAQATSQEIKALDANHLVSVGTQRAGFDEDAIEAFRRVHALDTIDIVSVHWGVKGLPEKELAIAHELGKPVYFGEIAMRGLDESCQPLSNEILQQRAEAVAQSILRSREAGVDGYLLWQYAYGAVGMGDHKEYYCGVYDYFADD